MSTVEVRTQAELDAALKKGGAWIDIRGGGRFTVTACGSSTVRACDSSTVTAYGSSTVRAYDSSTVRACDSSTVRACDSSTVTASALVPVQDHGPDTNITAAIVIPIRTPETMADWCDFYGVTTSRGWATVYKAVSAELVSDHGFAYPIGKEVACADWSDTPACGQGLHFSPRPFMAVKYSNGTTFIACRVKVAECVVLDDKLKAPRCKVVGLVDEDGNEVAS